MNIEGEDPKKIIKTNSGGNRSYQKGIVGKIFFFESVQLI